MYVRIGIHYPSVGKETFAFDALRKFQETQMRHKGLISIHALRDEETNVVVGLAIWGSKESYLAVREKIDKARRDLKFEQYDDRPLLVLSCVEAQT
jgi:hypothetical protein